MMTAKFKRGLAGQRAVPDYPHLMKLYPLAMFCQGASGVT